MDIIEKIEIKHFRSFDGGKDQTKVKIDGLRDLNVFSGANDSGKSNVLRALNLFFNDEISPGVPFDKTRDFSKIVANRFDEDIASRKKKQLTRLQQRAMPGTRGRDLRRSDEVISIKLFFNNINEQRGLPKKFWVSKSYSKKNNFEGEYIYQTSLKGNAQTTQFLNSFKFEYIPAIKDVFFFNQLFQKLQTYLFEKEDKKKVNKFASSSKNFNDALTSETKELFKKFQQSSGVEATFHIPSTLVDFFRTLSVHTENGISLFDRGDGVQARFIPEILDEISKATKRNIIWGFEEPENSYEVKNIRKLRDDFLNKFAKSKQIFITSHTKEFLSIKREYTKQEREILKSSRFSSRAKKEIAMRKLKLQNSSCDVSIYRVWKNETTNNTSYITRFDEQNMAWEDTCDDLGIIQEARIIEDLQAKLDAQAELIAESELSVDKQRRIREELNARDLQYYKLEKDNQDAQLIIEEYQKPILVVEDKYDAIYKIAFLKLHNISFTFENYKEVFKAECYFTIRRAEGAGSVAGKLRMNNTDGYDDKKIIGLFDFDRAGSENFYHLKNGANWDGNFQGEASTGIFKKRNDHGCFYALLLPIPERHNKLISNIAGGKFESFVEVENLLGDDILVDNGLVDEDEIMNIKYYKIKGNAKSKLPKILCGLDAEEYADFKPLYGALANLFGC